MKSVSKKLLSAIKDVGGEVPKTGWNSFSKYKYITESDINKVVLPALLKNGLLLTTSLESVQETPSSADSKNRFATVQLVHNIIDVETGETLTLKSAGTAADTLDKSIYKAYTGACKYFMMKLFIISGDDSDPENDGVTVKDEPVKPAATKTFSAPTVSQVAEQPKVEQPKLDVSQQIVKPAPTPVVAKVMSKTANTVVTKPSFGTPKVASVIKTAPVATVAATEPEPEF